MTRDGAPRRPAPEDLERLNADFETLHPREILRWAWEVFGDDVALSSSFQTQSVPLLHMVSQAAPEMPVLFLDTGFHFQETLTFRDQLVASLGLNLRVLTARGRAEGLESKRPPPYKTDPDLCCYLNKTEPLRSAQQGLAAWVTGIRRDQTHHRKKTPILAWLDRGLFKICPMATWTLAQVRSYIEEHGLAEHPLTHAGYRSIGCAPCTQPVADGGEERAGRWQGMEKTECGLHLESKEER